MRVRPKPLSDNARIYLSIKLMRFILAEEQNHEIEMAIRLEYIPGVSNEEELEIIEEIADWVHHVWIEKKEDCTGNPKTIFLGEEFVEHTEITIEGPVFGGVLRITKENRKLFKIELCKEDWAHELKVVLNFLLSGEKFFKSENKESRIVLKEIDIDRVFI